MQVLWLLMNELYFFKSLQGQINFKVPYKHLQWESRQRNYQFTSISEVLGEREDRRRYWCIPFFQSSLNKFKSIMDQMCCLGATCLAQCIVWMFEEVLKQTIIWGSSVHINKKAGWVWSFRISISFKRTYVHSIFSISDYIMCPSNDSLGYNLWPEKWL